MGQSIGVYEKEIRFYRDLKPKLRVRTPAHYYSALNAYDDPDVVIERLRSLNRLAMPLIAMLAIVVTWFIGLFPRRYVLLIEDVSHFRMGDQLNGCSEKDVRGVLDAMAMLHAQFWDSEQLESMSWIAPVELTSKLIHLTYLQAVEKYKRASKDQLSEHQLGLINWLKKTASFQSLLKYQQYFRNKPHYAISSKSKMQQPRLHHLIYKIRSLPTLTPSIVMMLSHWQLTG